MLPFHISEANIKMKNYEIKSVLTVVIDGKIKMVGIPDFPWICSDDLYRRLEKKYPLEIPK